MDVIIGFLPRYIVKYRRGGISFNRDNKNDIIYNDDLALAKEKEILPYVNTIKDVNYK